MKIKKMVLEIGLAKITSKNMIVIPKEARDKLHLKEGQQLQVFLIDDEIVLAPLLPLEELTGSLKGGMTVKELMKDARKNVSRFDRDGSF